MALQRQHRASGPDYAVDPHRVGGAEHRVIGWLQYVGLQNEQMTNLAWSIFAGILCGIIASCLTLNPQKLYWPTATALALIMIASLLDSQSNALTRPEQLMFSQFYSASAAPSFWPGDARRIGGVFADPRNRSASRCCSV